MLIFKNADTPSFPRKNKTLDWHMDVSAQQLEPCSQLRGRLSSLDKRRLRSSCCWTVAAPYRHKQTSEILLRAIRVPGPSRAVQPKRDQAAPGSVVPPRYRFFPFFSVEIYVVFFPPLVYFRSGPNGRVNSVSKSQSRSPPNCLAAWLTPDPILFFSSGRDRRRRGLGLIGPVEIKRSN